MPRAHIFIRNDDVWTLDRKFRFFFDMAIDHGVPVVHAVIPGKMDKGLMRFLCRAKEKTPALLDIVQHGWVHANHSSIKTPGKKYEFGPGRSYEVQQQDILQGVERMRAAFGGHFTEAFVPPFHGYDQQTWDILRKERFKIFSAGKNVLERKTGLIDLPATISFTKYAMDGTYTINTASTIVEKLVRNMPHQTLSGVLTHHADFTTAGFREELRRFFDQIALSMERDIWRVLLFSDLLKKRGG